MVARQGRNTRSGNRNARSAAAASGGPKKNLGWMGARPRMGRWASELRLKFKRQRLWIGTFATPEQAALAYDAATYCIYGNDIPRRVGSTSRTCRAPTSPRKRVLRGSPTPTSGPSPRSTPAPSPSTFSPCRLQLPVLPAAARAHHH
ncbi:hypothetical protein EJB05_48303, partial [Eragrostis curvula]